MHKFNDGTMDLTLIGKQLLGLISETKVSGDYSENSVSKEIFGIPNHCKSIIEENSNLRHILFAPLAESTEILTPLNTPTFRLDLKTSIDGSKDIIIELIQVRINVHFAIFQQLQNFFMFGLPDYTLEYDTPYDYMNKYRPSVERISREIMSQYLAPRMLVNICIRQPILILPSFVSQRVLVLQSNFNVLFLKEKEGLSSILETPISTLKVVVHELEIYTCRYQELMSKTCFKNLQKRRILEPLQVIYESIAMREDQFLINYITDCMIDKFTLIVSHQDVKLMGHIMKFQTDTQEREKVIIESLLGDSEKVKDEAKREISRRSDIYEQSPGESSQLPQDSQTTTNYVVSGFYIMIVNDAFGAYTPVIDLNAYEFIIKLAQNSTN